MIAVDPGRSEFRGVLYKMDATPSFEVIMIPEVASNPQLTSVHILYRCVFSEITDALPLFLHTKTAN